MDRGRLRRSARRAPVALGLAVVLVLIAASEATAGTYEVHGCRLPNGTTIPAEGWVRSADVATTGLNTCAAGRNGFLEGFTQAPYSHPAGAGIRYRFNAPPGTRVKRVRGHRWFYVRKPASGVNIVMGGSVDPSAQGYQELFCTNVCGGNLNRGSPSSWNASGNAFDTNTMSARLTDAGGYRFTAACSSSSSCPAVSGTAGSTAKAKMRVYRTQITLEDLNDPTIDSLRGPLVDSSGPHSGTVSAVLVASDVGSGVYRAIIEARDPSTGRAREVVRRVVDPNGGACRDQYDETISGRPPSGGGDRDFIRPVPCKLSVNTEFTLDTRSIPDGTYDLRVLVEDAAGNRRLARVVPGWRVQNAQAPSGPASASSGPPNGTNASPQARIRLLARSGRRTITTRYGRRVVIRGVLTDELGRPIEGATVRMRRRTDGTRRYIDAGGTRTRRGGRFTWITRHGPSRLLAAAYAHRRGSTSFRYSNRVRVRVRAGVLLRATRRTRNGRSARYLGAIRGGRVPRGGLIVEMQVRVLGRWKTFQTARGRGRWGLFRTRYRFRRTFFPTTYRFRARVRTQAGLPYTTGVSRVVSVRVRP